MSDDGLTELSKGQQCGRLSNSTQCQRQDGLLYSYPSLFCDVPTCTHVVHHDIDVGSASPIKQLAYRCPIGCKRETMKIEVECLLAHWPNPAVVLGAPHAYWLLNQMALHVSVLISGRSMPSLYQILFLCLAWRIALTALVQHRSFQN